jgi:hypothetical protein
VVCGVGVWGREGRGGGGVWGGGGIGGCGMDGCGMGWMFRVRWVCSVAV